MMPSVPYGVHTPGPLPSSYPHDGFLNDLSTQVALSQAARRYSRSSNGQRTGSAMRVVKPNSANNSPNSSMMMGRRRTMMGDYPTPRRHQQTDYLSVPHGIDAVPSRRQTSRPLSWHPSSHSMQPPPAQYLAPHTGYGVSTPSIYGDQRDIYHGYPQFSPMMASYSTNTSPSSTFSPLPHGLPSLDTTEQYMPAGGWEFANRHQASFDPVTPNDDLDLTEPFPALNGAVNEKHNPSDAGGWNSFLLQNTQSTSSETFLPMQLSETLVPKEPMVHQDVDEVEEEGEILVGMGLYDTVDQHEDTQMQHFRSTVSSLLGGSFRLQEPMGKGLKLEETWSPPKSDDGDSDSDNDNDENGQDSDESD